MTPRAHHNLLTRALLLSTLVLMLSSCERVRALARAEAEAPKPPAESVEFEVDGDGVFYGTLTPSGRLHGADRLARVPLAERVAVVVHVNGKTAELDDRYYVADLVEASPGDTASARLRSADQVRTLLAVGEEAALLGLAVRDTVQSMTGLDQDDDETEPVKSRARIRKGRRAPKTNVRDVAAKGEESEKSEAIELFTDAEITSQTGGVTSSGGDSGKIEIRHINGSRTATNTTRRGPIAGGGWKSVTMYYASWCGVCRRAKRWLDKHKVPYRLVDIEASKRNKAEMVRFCLDQGAKPGSVPTFRIDGDTIMQGWSAEHFKRLAKY